jgi:hypothetical protein
MVRAAVAICVPLAVTIAAHKGALGSLPAMGGLLGTVADNGGPYPARVRRVASATVFGGAAGLAIGSVIHGHGWVAVAGLVLVAAASGVLSGAGDIGSITGLQLLVYTAVGLGPAGSQRPIWHTAAGFAAGAAWALLLTVPGWLHSPHGTELRDVAAVYDALAAKLAAIGTEAFAARRQDVTAALNTAYDEVLNIRAASAGRNPSLMRLVALLNASQLVAEATTALGLAGAVRPLVAGRHPAPASAAADAAGTAGGRPDRASVHVAADDVHPGGGSGHRGALAAAVLLGAAHGGDRVQAGLWISAGQGAAAGHRYGVRHAGRGGAADHCARPVAAVPFAVLVTLVPYGRARNYGLMTVFITPLAVVLIDLNQPAGWQSATISRRRCPPPTPAPGAGPGCRTGRGCAAAPTGRSPTCAPSSSGRCRSRRRSAALPLPGGRPW